MLGQPRVIGRALDGEVERDLELVLPRVLHQPLELLDRAEARIDRVVTAQLAADRPRAAGIVRPCLQRVVAALAAGAADRVDRRQVEHVEAELRELRQQRAHALEAAPRARKELVPRAEARELTVDVDAVRRRRRRVRTVSGRSGERLLEREGVPAEQHRAFRQLAGQILLSRVHLAAELLLERGDAVDPGVDAELPAAGAVDLEGAAPLVVAESHQRRLAPPRRARRLRADGRAEHVVAVAEDPRGHLDPVADRPLHRIPPAVDLRLDPLDLDPRRGLARLREGHAPDVIGDPEGDVCVGWPLEAAALLRDPAPSDVAPRRAAGRRGVPVRRLARGGGAVVVADAPARAAGRVPLAVRVAVGVCRVSRPAGEARRAGDADGDGRLRRAAPVLDRRVGALRAGRRDRGSGAVRARVDRAARVRARPRRAADRRRADLRLRRQRRRGGPAGAVRARPGGRRAAGRAERERPVLGQPALRLAGAPSDGISLVDRALPPHVRARRPCTRRPLPRLRLLLGDSGAEQDRTPRQVAARSRGGALPRSRARARRSCR